MCCNLFKCFCIMFYFFGGCGSVDDKLSCFSIYCGVEFLVYRNIEVGLVKCSVIIVGKVLLKVCCSEVFSLEKWVYIVFSFCCVIVFLLNKVVKVLKWEIVIWVVLFCLEKLGRYIIGVMCFKVVSKFCCGFVVKMIFGLSVVIFFKFGLV